MKMDAAEVNPVPQNYLVNQFAAEDYEEEDRQETEPRAPNPKQALFVDFAERDDSGPMLTA
jgi:hypothetical protein